MKFKGEIAGLALTLSRLGGEGLIFLGAHLILAARAEEKSSLLTPEPQRQ
jgi:hypothetical protein